MPIICGGITCCAEWQQVAEAYAEGRRDEAVVKMIESMRAGPITCRIARMLRDQMIRDGEIRRGP